MVMSGCALPLYVPPSGPDTAKLTFQNYSVNNVSLIGYKVGKDCSGGALQIVRPNKLLPKKALTITVKADEEFSFSYSYYIRDSVGVTTSCTLPVTFTPHKGMQYVSQFNADDKKCYVSLVSVQGNKVQKEPSFRLRTPITPTFDEKGAFCK